MGDLTTQLYLLVVMFLNLRQVVMVRLKVNNGWF
ncbi:hypothetical protein CsSME_00053968 [Camellia sinensis var. sinensis]